MLLAAAGDAGAHERVRRLTLACEQRGTSLLEAARADPAVWERLDRAVRARFGSGAQEFFSRPEHYAGRAGARARALAARYRTLMQRLAAEPAASAAGN